MKRLFSVLFLCIAFAGMLAAQPTGKIRVVGVPDKFKAKNAGFKTTGLKNVGKGERVVLEAWAIAGTAYADTILTATSATWSFKSKPASSTAVIADTGATNQIFVYFVPDVIGTYEVEMTATTAELGPVGLTSVKITVSTYKGVGIYNASTKTYDNFNCQPCHTANAWVFAEYSQTNHAGVMPMRLNEVGGHFSNSCLACHTVGMMGGTPVPDNNNFEKVRTTVGWSVPHNGPNQYEDSLVATQPVLAGLSGIQCENCHGPLMQHFGPGVGVDANLRSEVCAPCHFSSDRHPKGYSWDASGHAKSFDEGKEWSYMNRATCSQCHTGNGFVEAYNNIPGATTGRYEDPVGITCAACHDPHNKTNPFQLRRASTAEACIGCHQNRISSRGVHHSHQGPMILGTETTPYTGAPASGIGMWAGWELPGYVYDNGSHSEIEERCAACHMAPTPTFDPTYATPDTLLNRVGGHTFAVAWDHDTPDDESDDLLNYVGCEECHGEVTIEFVHLTQEKTHALLDTLAALLPEGTNGLPLPHTNATLTPLQKAASYNYYFVEADGSFGAHNFKYAEGLLKSSIEQVKLGQGSANIVSVSDIPNDQGKQVQLVWNKFPAETFSFDRLVKYGIWRLDPSFGNAPAGKFISLSEIFTSAPVGGTVTNGPVVWTYVAEVPASGLDAYAYIAPTLTDSTVAGMVQSTFMIAGYTNDGMKLYASMPDSGFSVDNLMPTKPAGVVAAYQSGSVILAWATPTDPDIDVHNVYRSTTAGFDPNTTPPIASVKGIEFTDNAVTPGTQYYYRIGAVDFNGNKGPFSDEVSIITGITAEQGIPTVFALKQNYPNPFNPSTEIGFSVPKSVRVQLSVYTVTGELIATLVDEDMAAGNYTVTWNGEGFTGRPVSSGLYLYRIEAGDFVSVRKMVLLK